MDNFSLLGLRIYTMATDSQQSHRVAEARQRVVVLQTIDECRRKVLLGMLDYLKSPGLNMVTNDIFGCANDEELRELASYYVSSIFKPSMFPSFPSYYPSACSYSFSSNMLTFPLVKSMSSKASPPSPTTLGDEADMGEMGEIEGEEYLSFS